MRGFWSNAFTVALVLGGAAVGAFALAERAYRGPGPLGAEVVVHVERGQSLAQIADALAEQQVIDSAFLFVAAARTLGVAADVKAGDYAFAPGVAMEEVLDTVTQGRAVEHRVTVAEGLTVLQVAEILRAADVLVGEIESLPPEGMLAPDTYFVRRGETRQAVIDRMRAAQDARLAELWATRAPDLPISTPEEAMILASIIEKETGVAAERELVASVFVNRLRKGMRLQTDPTVIYGVTGGTGALGRSITRSDLETVTEYNTYKIDGLPPTPIANPGRASIAAALNPVESEYLFFVADGTGGHAFAKTLREHNRNVAEWRKIERQRRAAGVQAVDG